MTYIRHLDPLNSVFKLATIALCAAALAPLWAADDDLRIVPQVMVGTAGFEPGVALEWRAGEMERVVFRPEAFISEDGRLGGGGAILYDLSTDLNLPHGQALSVGPRFVGHNSDDTGWEADALVSYVVSLSGVAKPWRHAIGALGALGVRDNREDDRHDLGASAGIFYSFRF